MKNNLKKWIVIMVLMAIVVNVFSGFNSTVNANELNLETTEAIETETTPETPKEDVPTTESKESKPTEPETVEKQDEKETVTETNETTTLPAKEKDEIDTQTSEEESTDKPEMGKVVVNYFAGHIDLGTETHEGEIGTSYKIEVKDFSGYRFEKGDNLEGEYSEEVTYIFLEYVSEEIEIELSLYIEDEYNAAGLRPEDTALNLTFTLFRNGVEVTDQEKELDSETNDIEFVFEGKYPRFDENGNEYKYTIEVKGFPKEYYINLEYLMKDFDRYMYDISAQLILDSWDINIYKEFYTDEITVSSVKKI